MKILVTGSNGLLGQKIVAQAIKHAIPFLASSIGENRNSNCPEQNYCALDITNRSEVMECIKRYNPTHILHTAAMTNVDQCELNPEACRTVNTLAVEYLFSAAKEVNAHFQLLSTDFVFDGEKGNYSEEDQVNPLSVYADSKVQAEKLLLTDKYTNWSIVRTIIVYGVGENLSRTNIVCWAKSALQKGETLTIVDDQFRSPTWADDLAWACLEIARREERGIFHISGPETMSIYALVRRIAEYYNLPTDNLKKSKSSELNQPASRPPKTGFNLTKAKNRLGYTPKTIEETLDLI